METFFLEVAEVAKTIFVEVFGILWKVITKGLLFLIWALPALIILPCVFVAGHIYPLWVEWGEEF